MTLMTLPSNLRNRIGVIIALFAFILSPIASYASDDSAVDDILERGTLRVGLSSFVPWAMRSKDGDFIGFEVDVAKAVAKDMGVEIEIIPTAWDGLIPALLSKKIDVIIAGMSITPERSLQVNFSIPYSKIGLGIFANTKVASDLKNLADYNSSDVTFSLRRGTLPVAYVKKNFPNAKIKQFDDDSTARQEVLNGRAHAMIAGEPFPAFSVIDHPETLFKPIDDLGETTLEGFALRKGDSDSENFFNNWIRVNQNNGWLKQRHQYWFGSRDWANQVE